jgi:hypothetical protein
MNRRLVLGAGAAAAAVALAVTALTGRDDPAEPDLEIGVTEHPYRIVYLLDDLADDAVEASTDELWVRPPFDSRLETRAGAPPGAEVVAVQVAVMDRLRIEASDTPLVFARVPGLAPSDVRMAPIVAAGEAAGLLERGEHRTVAGRRCQVLRSGTLLGAGPLVPITEDEHAESCIDGDGLLLEETLFLGGRPTLHRRAVEIDLSPAIDDDLFAAGDIVLPVDQGGGSSRPVDPDSGAEGSFWVLPEAARPRGFAHVGRFSVITPQTERFAEPGRSAVVAGTVDVFVRGADYVTVHQGGTLGRVPAFATPPDAPAIDGGAVGAGALVLSATGSELRFPQTGGRFVHLAGTLPPDDLAMLARQLEETEGSGLVYLDG